MSRNLLEAKRLKTILKNESDFLGADAEMLFDLSAAETVAAEKDNIEESKKGVPSKTKQGRCAKQKKDVIEAP